MKIKQRGRYTVRSIRTTPTQDEFLEDYAARTGDDEEAIIRDAIQYFMNTMDTQ